MWAINSVPKPMCRWTGRRMRPCAPFSHRAKASQPPKNATNSRHRLTPVTMSALVMGMLLTVISGPRHRFFILKKPIAAMVPAPVAETRRVDDRALMICRSRTSSPYHRRVKPCQTVRLLESLKEKTISTKIGA